MPYPNEKVLEANLARNGQWESTRANITRIDLLLKDFGIHLPYVAYRFRNGDIWDSHAGWRKGGLPE